MKKKLVPYLVSLLFLVLPACSNPSPTDPVTNNDVVAKDLGIPYVTLTSVFTGKEKNEIIQRFQEAASGITSISLKQYAFLSNYGYLQQEINYTSEINIFGLDDEANYAEYKSETKENSTYGGAYAQSLTSKRAGQLAVNNGDIIYSKTKETSTSGAEEVVYSASTKEANSTFQNAILKKTQSDGSVLSSSFSAIPIGTSSDGRLWGVSYSFSQNTTAAYNKDGEQVSGFSRRYSQVLFDFNTVKNPKLLSYRSVSLTESDVDGNGIKQDTYRTTYKESQEYQLKYDKLSGKETERKAVIEETPSLFIANLEIGLKLGTSSYTSKYLETELERRTENELVYVGSVALTKGNYYSFSSSGNLSILEKQTETLLHQNFGYLTTVISDSVKSKTGTIFSFSGDSVSCISDITVNVHFTISKTDPYVMITAIDY